MTPDASEERSGQRHTFRFGEAFPADHPVAVLVVAMATAFNDLLRTNLRLLTDEDSYEGERLYLLRISFAQLHELRESIKHARKDNRVATFLEGLSEEARGDLALVIRLNPGTEPWVAKAISYVRNQTIHYGGKFGWEAQTWALKALADEEGEVVSNSLFSGLQLRFADLVAVQHFTRKAPEFDDDPHASPDEEVLRSRLRTLFTAASTTTTSALRLIDASVNSYLASLPPGVVNEVSES